MVDDPTASPSQGVHRPRRWPKVSAFAILGWIAGAFSLLKLIEDLNLVEIFGLLKQWLEAYSDAIGRLNWALFGWIDFGDLNVTNGEAHVLLVGSILCVAYGRAYAARMKQRMPMRWHTEVAMTIFSVTMAWVFILLPALFLAGDYGLFGSLFMLGILVGVFFVAQNKNDPHDPTRLEVVQQLGGMIALLALMVVANYSVLRAIQ